MKIVDFEDHRLTIGGSSEEIMEVVERVGFGPCYVEAKGERETYYGPTADDFIVEIVKRRNRLTHEGRSTSTVFDELHDLHRWVDEWEDDDGDDA